MYVSNFKRVEEKYLITKEQYEKLFNEIGKNIEKDKYYESTICNVYFDTEHNDLVVDSIEKPIYKHKVRLRSYGVPKEDDDVFLEIKSKYKKIVGKRRIKMSLKEYENYIENKEFDENNQIMREVDYLFKHYKLNPSYFIAYDRKSYKGVSDDGLRITVDSNLRSRHTDLDLSLGDNGSLYFDKEMYLLEIKTLGAMPMWLIKPLSELKIYPVSFSKYGNIYTKNKENVLC